MIINIPGSSLTNLALWQWMEEIAHNSISGYDTSMCLQCRHFDRSKLSAIISCTAFPDGIPEDILFGIAPHDCPYSGDKGIMFEPVSQKLSYP